MKDTLTSQISRITGDSTHTADILNLVESNLVIEQGINGWTMLLVLVAGIVATYLFTRYSLKKGNDVESKNYAGSPKDLAVNNVNKVSIMKKENAIQKLKISALELEIKKMNGDVKPEET